MSVTPEQRHAETLVQSAREAGLELFLWRKRVYWPKDSGAPAGLKAELVKCSTEVKTVLMRQYALERSETRRSHRWVIRLGDDSSPALLACGPEAWYRRLMRQAATLSSTEEERLRWLVLEQDHVGSLFVDERGVTVATVVTLPNGYKLGGRKGSLAEVVSACRSCMTPPETDAKTKEIVENDKD